jgi:uncharacterized protein (TIGR02596 family)
MKTLRLTRSPAGFTIIELLAVMTIIAILAALSSMGLSAMMRSNSISIAANLVTSELNHARVAAMSHNSNAELRVITSTTTPCIEIVLIQNNGTNVQLTRPQYLPAGVAISPNATYSGVMSMTPGTVPAGQLNAGATYYAVRFSATGIPRDSSNNALTTSNNFLTLLSTQDASKSKLPSNWVTVTIDDRTGTVRRYQP